MPYPSRRIEEAFFQVRADAVFAERLARKSESDAAITLLLRHVAESVKRIGVSHAMRVSWGQNARRLDPHPIPKHGIGHFH
ncbi:MULTISPECIES: hypothetical protein [unclassified Methylomonas]|uniref:hypothetical protein n=1 Tax=unclassified Methylomonas TaxID=2608980 RepID=UPI00068E1C9D|nr:MULTISPECIES: hypothetical protein [unclassified Methylomonas]